MDFSLKLVTDEDDLVCMNHEFSNDELYELRLPIRGEKSTEILVLCTGCLEALHTILGLGSQFGMNDFSPIEATITIPDKSRY